MKKGGAMRPQGRHTLVRRWNAASMSMERRMRAKQTVAVAHVGVSSRLRGSISDLPSNCYLSLLLVICIKALIEITYIYIEFLLVGFLASGCCNTVDFHLYGPPSFMVLFLKKILFDFS